MEIRVGQQSSMHSSDVFTDSSGSDSDGDSNGVDQSVSETNPEDAVRSIAEKIFVTNGPKYFGIIGL